MFPRPQPATPSPNAHSGAGAGMPHPGEFRWKSWIMAHSLNSRSGTGAKQMDRLQPFTWAGPMLETSA